MICSVCHNQTRTTPCKACNPEIDWQARWHKFMKDKIILLPFDENIIKYFLEKNNGR